MTAVTANHIVAMLRLLCAECLRAQSVFVAGMRGHIDLGRGNSSSHAMHVPSSPLGGLLIRGRACVRMDAESKALCYFYRNPLLNAGVKFCHFLKLRRWCGREIGKHTRSRRSPQLRQSLAEAEGNTRSQAGRA